MSPTTDLHELPPLPGHPSAQRPQDRHRFFAFLVVGAVAALWAGGGYWYWYALGGATAVPDPVTEARARRVLGGSLAPTLLSRAGAPVRTGANPASAERLSATETPAPSGLGNVKLDMTREAFNRLQVSMPEDLKLYAVLFEDGGDRSTEWDLARRIAPPEHANITSADDRWMQRAETIWDRAPRRPVSPQARLVTIVASLPDASSPGRSTVDAFVSAYGMYDATHRDPNGIGISFIWHTWEPQADVVLMLEIWNQTASGDGLETPHCARLWLLSRSDERIDELAKHARSSAARDAQRLDRILGSLE